MGRLILVVEIVFVNGNWSSNWKCLLAEGNKEDKEVDLKWTIMDREMDLEVN